LASHFRAVLRPSAKATEKLHNQDDAGGRTRNAEFGFQVHAYSSVKVPSRTRTQRQAMLLTSAATASTVATLPQNFHTFLQNPMVERKK